MNGREGLIVTLPPYAPFVRDVIAHPAVAGIRLNTVMPTEPLDDLLLRLKDAATARNKEFYIDLKSKQLRVKTFGVPPFTEIELTHAISVKTPVTAYFSNGDESATILRVEKNRLIMQEGPARVVGPGESVNIPDPSLTVDGLLTETDLAYVAAARKIGIHDYMLSFVESERDIDALRALDPEARIIAKIESRAGIDYVRKGYAGSSRLMAARGDLYIELPMPHDIIPALETILKADPFAIAASRIFSSLAKSPEPSSADIGDLDSLLRMGYRSFMFGDEVCQRRESVLGAINLYRAMTEKRPMK